MNWVLIVIGVIAAALGVFAYLRVWRNWIRPVAPGHYGYSVGFGFLLFGIAAIAIGISSWLLAAELRSAAVVVGAIGALAMLSFAVSLFWMPRFLLPAWFKTLKGLS